ncbi:MAG: endo-1,4-beta-xylanase, partial [Promicromonosporaceae bacterium]|nr:endo-1,4-beta-xylanase [Promicromonosporaceae bacterium]
MKATNRPSRRLSQRASRHLALGIAGSLALTMAMATPAAADYPEPAEAPAEEAVYEAPETLAAPEAAGYVGIDPLLSWEEVFTPFERIDFAGLDFDDDGAALWIGDTGWRRDGDAEMEILEEDGLSFLSFTRPNATQVWQGITGPYNLVQGDVLEFRALARLAEESTGTVNASFRANTATGWPLVAANPVFPLSTEWIEITQRLTVPAAQDGGRVVFSALGPGGTEDDVIHLANIEIDVVTTVAVGDSDVIAGFDGWIPRSGPDARHPRHGHLGDPIVDPSLLPTLAPVAGPNGAEALAVTNRQSNLASAQIDMLGRIMPTSWVTFSADLRFLDAGVSGPLTLARNTAINNPPTMGVGNLCPAFQVTDDWASFECSFAMPQGQIVKWFYLNSEAGNTADFAMANVSFEFISPVFPELPPLYSFMDGIPLGMAIDYNETFGVDGDLVTTHFNSITNENHMKPEAWFQSQIAGGGSGNPVVGIGGNAAFPTDPSYRWDFTRISGPGVGTPADHGPAGITWDNGFRIHPQAIATMEFAVENGLGMFGHVLVWHSQVPEWFFMVDPSGANGPVDTTLLVAANGTPAPGWTRDEVRAEMLVRMENHMWNVNHAITSHWGLYGSDTNPFTSWEVVNEIVGPVVHDLANSTSTMAGSPTLTRPASLGGGSWPAGTSELRNTHWARTVGGDFSHWAFYFANNQINGEFNVAGSATNPVGVDAPSRIHLWNNDYNTERDQLKLGRMISLTEHKIRSGIVMDGMGHQFHVSSTVNVNGMRTALNLTTDMNNRLAADGFHTVVTGVTELDVVFDGNAGNLQTRLDSQGWYFYQAFNIFREWNEQNPGKFAYLTVWGLHDARSWRTAGIPIIWDEARLPKPAFWGAAGNPGATPEGIANGWPRLPLQIQTLDVFAGAPSAADADFGTADWGSTPTRGLGLAGDVVLRQIAGAGGSLVVLATVADAVDTLEIDYQFSPSALITIGRDGAVTGNATATVREVAGGWEAIIHVPHTIGAGNPDLDIRGLAGDTVIGALSANFRMQLAFQVGFQTTYFMEAPVAPELGGDRDPLWDTAVWEHTGHRQQGAAPAGVGARADFATLWVAGGAEALDPRDGSVVNVDTLFVRAEVTDDDINNVSAERHNQDSIEVFLDLGNAKAGSYRDVGDLQFRFQAIETSWVREGTPTLPNAEVMPPGFSHGAGNLANQRARLHQLHVQMTYDEQGEPTGYIVEAEIGLWFFNEHPSPDNSVSAINAFHGFDLQVNDARSPQNSRQAVWVWSNPNTTGWSVTTNWGVAQQVSICAVDGLGDLWSNDPLCVEPDVTFGADRLGVRRGNRFFKNLELVGGTAEITFTFGREADEVFIGDWNGDGIDTPAIRRGNR